MDKVWQTSACSKTRSKHIQTNKILIGDQNQHAWYFVHQPTCHGPSGASTLPVLRGRPVRLQTWNDRGILEPSTEVDCSHLSLTVTMYNMCKRKAKKKTSNYLKQTATCTVVRFSRYARYVFRSWWIKKDTSNKPISIQDSECFFPLLVIHNTKSLTWMIHAEFSPPLIIRPTTPEVNSNKTLESNL